MRPNIRQVNNLFKQIKIIIINMDWYTSEEGYKNIENFDTSKHLNKFNDIIKKNKVSKLNIDELIKQMSHFHLFTEESMLHMIYTINRWPNTFWGFGPYINKNGYWVVGEKKEILNKKDNIRENEIRVYEKIVDELKTRIVFLEKKVLSLQTN